MYKNKKIEKSMIERCEEIKGIVRILKRANATGDDVRIEIESGLNLLTSVTGELSDLINDMAA